MFSIQNNCFEIVCIFSPEFNLPLELHFSARHICECNSLKCPMEFLKRCWQFRHIADDGPPGLIRDHSISNSSTAVCMLCLNRRRRFVLSFPTLIMEQLKDAGNSTWMAVNRANNGPLESGFHIPILEPFFPAEGFISAPAYTYKYTVEQCVSWWPPPWTNLRVTTKSRHLLRGNYPPAVCVCYAFPLRCAANKRAESRCSWGWDRDMAPKSESESESQSESESEARD